MKNMSLNMVLPHNDDFSLLNHHTPSRTFIDYSSQRHIIYQQVWF